jgi:hypothetical protein
MKYRVCLLMFIMVMGVFTTSVLAEQNKSKTVSVLVSSDDTILDGMPSDFDLKQFTQKLTKMLLRKMKDEGIKIDNDKFDYLVKVDIELMRHKLLPFHFGISYVIDYKYVLLNADKKELLRVKSDGNNFNQIELINEVTTEIVKGVL